MIETKLIEIRDSMTFIPALATRLVAVETQRERDWRDEDPEETCGYDTECWLLGCAGLGRLGSYTVLLGHMQDNKYRVDSCEWGSARTMRVVHEWLEQHWDEVRSGDVIDVEFILGETSEPKRSERLT